MTTCIFSLYILLWFIIECDHQRASDHRSWKQSDLYCCLIRIDHRAFNYTFILTRFWLNPRPFRYNFRSPLLRLSPLSRFSRSLFLLLLPPHLSRSRCLLLPSPPLSLPLSPRPLPPLLFPSPSFSFPLSPPPLPTSLAPLLPPPPTSLLLLSLSLSYPLHLSPSPSPSSPPFSMPLSYAALSAFASFSLCPSFYVSAFLFNSLCVCLLLFPSPLSDLSTYISLSTVVLLLVPSLLFRYLSSAFSCSLSFSLYLFTVLFPPTYLSYVSCCQRIYLSFYTCVSAYLSIFRAFSKSIAN